MKITIDQATAEKIGATGLNVGDELEVTAKDDSGITLESEGEEEETSENEAAPAAPAGPKGKMANPVADSLDEE